MADTGQVSTQAPQSIQVSASITRLLSCSLIAFTGHESSHAAQFVQSSVMEWDTVSPPYKSCFPMENHYFLSQLIFKVYTKILMRTELFTNCVELRKTLLYKTKNSFILDICFSLGVSFLLKL